MKATMTIAEAASTLKKSARTVRRWIDLGILTPIGLRTGSRRLSRDAVASLAEVLEAVRSAMSFREVAGILGMGVAGVRKMVQRGRLPVLKAPDGSVGVCRATVARMLEAGAFHEGARTAALATVRA